MEKQIGFRPTRADKAIIDAIVAEYGVNGADALRLALLKWKKPSSDAEKVKDYQTMLKQRE